MLRVAQRVRASSLLSWLSTSFVNDVAATAVAAGTPFLSSYRVTCSEAGCSTAPRAARLGCRYFASPADNGAGATHTAERQRHVDVAASVLQQIAVRGLCQHLEKEAQERIVVPEGELLLMVKSQGVTNDDQEAARIIDALQISGVILRYQGKVFIKPEEVAEMVVRALPDTVEEAEGKVKEISAELEPLEKEFAQIERQAFTWRTFVAYSGLFLLLAQFSLFARLTYWELSWDVMEPISYFTGQLVMICCYVYFLYTHRDFGYENHFNKITQESRQALMHRKHFDLARFQFLKQELVRWQRYTHGLTTRRGGG